MGLTQVEREVGKLVDDAFVTKPEAFLIQGMDRDMQVGIC